MEPSPRDEVLVELYGALYASQREESYLSLDALARILVECVGDDAELLAEFIYTEYDKRQAPAA
jgi:hypothetical protein